MSGANTLITPVTPEEKALLVEGFIKTLNFVIAPAETSSIQWVVNSPLTLSFSADALKTQTFQSALSSTDDNSFLRTTIYVHFPTDHPKTV